MRTQVYSKLLEEALISVGVTVDKFKHEMRLSAVTDPSGSVTLDGDEEHKSMGAEFYFIGDDEEEKKDDAKENEATEVHVKAKVEASKEGNEKAPESATAIAIAAAATAAPETNVKKVEEEKTAGKRRKTKKIKRKKEKDPDAILKKFIMQHLEKDALD